MSRILLLLKGAENRRLLAEFLGAHHQLGFDASEDVSDLILTDPAALREHAELLRTRRREAEPALLPVLLVAPRHDAPRLDELIPGTVDEIVLTPVEKVELSARVEMLLRARRLSLELRLRTEDLEAFINAMTHDLRAPLRTLSGFAEAIAEDQSSRLDATGRHQLDRIQAAVRQMSDLIECLLEFSRIGRKAIRLRRVSLDDLVAQWVAELAPEIESRGAGVLMAGPFGQAEADPALLKIAVCNMLSNGMKYVAAGVKPQVEIAARREGRAVRLTFRDNGIGMSEEEQRRIFAPFVRLHGMEDFPGVGLGLSSARKAIEMMGGQTGVISSPGAGSTFWIELAV